MFQSYILSLALILALFPTLLVASPSCETIAPEVSLHNSEAHTALQIELPSAGVLSLEFSHRVQIGLSPNSCGDGIDVLVVERSEEHLQLAASTEGVVTLHITRADGKGGFRVESAFTPAWVASEHFDLGDLPVRRTTFYPASALAAVDPLKTDPENADPDPDGLSTQPASPLAVFLTVDLALLSKPQSRKADSGDLASVH